MTLLSSQLKLYLTGGAGNSDPHASLGGVTSSTLFVDNVLNNLFRDVTAAEAAAGSVKYRALAFKNISGVDTAFATLFYILLETTSAGTEIDIAYDATGTQSIANEDTPPVGLTFSRPLSQAAAIQLGDVPAGGERRVWFKRTVTAGAGYTTNDFGRAYFLASTI